MLFRINPSTAYPDHTVAVTWSDRVMAVVDLAPVIAKGPVFAAMQDGAYFIREMRIATDRLGLEWPNRVDFSADGLHFRAFREVSDAEFRMPEAGTKPESIQHAT